MSRGRIGGAVARGAIAAIELYRNMISPYRPPSCRFTPTCSQYAVDALREFGVVRGSWLSLVRLAKCGPWHPGGWDPIPERHEVAPDATTLRSDSFV
ncbi:membrane protein insertion efficiency factor YidD [Mycobacterium yunnanensis]|uniref:Putative membrane protein insertion efficiency factor n=1 Tax=Mycobacterium yunnanensis TaxID=368477 RepID=A0A9X2Z217_9MYCO|nr:membrane protein insertion efficiency factor YidD [Mycobacterium yunnanensis]MCV7420677.1 membrane protein insertion efficiency factor YidD [Mycobacterium yunnanensis]